MERLRLPEWLELSYSGTKQSPIVLSHSVAAAPSYLFGAYNPVNASIDFYDTTTYISGNFGEVYTMTIDKKGLPFKATEIRLRCESEHVIKFDGKDTFTRYPLELQVTQRQLRFSTF